ncbi:MAG: CstA-like transporter-associated (seleno)protein [Steroidobacteraceae bacterium]
MRKRLASLWSLLRTLASDDAYERYLEHHAQAHSGAPPLDRRAFYLREQQRKWTGVSRCC